MNTFKKYSNYYDTIYKDKDYEKESDFLFLVIKKYSKIKVKNILSLGCGTASYEILLAKKGFKIVGIDRSEKMIEIAKEKKENLDIKFKIADISNFRVNKKFDFGMAMFNIVGYMVENDMMGKMLKNVSNSLKKNALFVFDFWYGPAVLKSRPENKEKLIENGLIRKTTQKLDIEKSIIDINFKIIKKQNNVFKNITKENHKIRFWYFKELEYFLNKNGFKMCKICNFLDLNCKISEKNWNTFVIAKKI